MNLEHNSEYRQAQEKLAWVARCMEYIGVCASVMTGKGCPVKVSAKDYDDFVKACQLEVRVLFIEEIEKSEAVVAKNQPVRGAA